VISFEIFVDSVVAEIRTTQFLQIRLVRIRVEKLSGFK
jgi:hypothetical protein